MILVDTTVVIDFLRNRSNPKSELFKRILAAEVQFGFSAFTMQEVLQGSKTPSEFLRMTNYFNAYPIIYPDQSSGTYICAASLYADLRRVGVTIRNSMDTLIAATAIINDMPLLHNDRDFDAIAAKFPALRILDPEGNC
ncbi:MAG: PIN domain-containing protein [Oscillospiraceae bacterium]|jgi:predicted nucleic acid-binding protein|nr:PIN domain-containing protein [Oscillospiraceae bacterium]